MGKYNTIAVIYGSDSSEWEVACRSGEFTASRIDDTAYDVYEIFARFGVWSLVAYRKKNSMRVPFPEEARPQIDKNDFSVNVYGEKIKFDFVYIMHSGCSAFVSAVAFDKYSCKSYLRDADYVKLAPDAFVRKGMDVNAFAKDAVARLGLPLFVKPTDGGSSFGISKVKEADALASAVNFAFSEGPAVVVEKAIVGEEFTCAAYTSHGHVKALPVIQILTDNEYFDYDAKYNGNSREVCPAPISEAQSSAIQKVTERIYTHLGCNGIVRMDYILAEDGLYFLEVNTIPGMTSASLVPKMVRAAGLDVTEFLTDVIENS